jgi:hypothetical protein
LAWNSAHNHRAFETVFLALSEDRKRLRSSFVLLPERRTLPPIDEHCQEKNRFFKESVHIGPIGGKLSAL